MDSTSVDPLHSPINMPIDQESGNQPHPIVSASLSNTDLLIEEIQRDIRISQSQSSCCIFPIDDDFTISQNVGDLSNSSSSLSLNPNNIDDLEHVANQEKGKMMVGSCTQKKNNANNNFRKQHKYSYLHLRRKSWRQLNVKDRIKTLAQPKSNTNQCHSSGSERSAGKESHKTV